MATKSNLCIVAYDIPDNRLRLRVSRLISGYGIRVQRSVFECRLTTAQRHRLVRRLEALGMDAGYIYIYRMAYQTERIGIGNCPDYPFREDRHAWIIE